MIELKGKRVLITGGAGFIGSHIVDQLCDEGCIEIVALDNMVRGRPENLRRALGRGPVRLVHGDIRDRKLMEALVKAADIVFHQAALRITHCAAEPRLAKEVMVDATYDLLELCIKHDIEKVIAASSASVYGLAEEFPTTERQNPYNNRDAIRSGQGVQRRAAAGLQRHMRPRLRGIPIFQRLWQPHGHPRTVHRGPDPLDGAA
ncbi:nucleoside-diphosphate-sugar epimerase [Bradyrhizobium ottawaense]